MPLPHRKGPPLDGAAVSRLLPSVPAWTAASGFRIERKFRFPDFKSALAFTNRVGAIAEAEDHHPELIIAWGFVNVVFTTNSAGGLTENDFAMARKIDALDAARKETP